MVMESGAFLAPRMSVRMSVIVASTRSKTIGRRACVQDLAPLPKGLPERVQQASGVRGLSGTSLSKAGEQCGNAGSRPAFNGQRAGSGLHIDAVTRTKQHTVTRRRSLHHNASPDDEHGRFAGDDIHHPFRAAHGGDGQWRDNLEARFGSFSGASSNNALRSNYRIHAAVPVTIPSVYRAPSSTVIVRPSRQRRIVRAVAPTRSSTQPVLLVCDSAIFVHPSQARTRLTRSVEALRKNRTDKLIEVLLGVPRCDQGAFLQVSFA